MGKNVIISVKGTQASSPDNVNKIELVTEGKYYKKGDAYFVSYKETEMTGMEGTTTTLKIDNDRVTLMRFGSTNSQLIFEQGQKHVSYYDTMYGFFTVGVFASEVSINVNDHGGEVAVDYQIEIDSNQAALNDFRMHIRETGGPGDEPDGMGMDTN